VAELAPRYDPKTVEGPLYQRWQDAKAFRADPKSEKPPFVIVIPPPNVTGSLHMGHALNNSLQDILIRWKRMQGYEACWIPGTDHASIAVTVLLERELKKEGKTRQDLGREKFLERAWAWKEKYGNRIVEQLKLMGCSCDWERERFTMDEGLSQAVVEHFVRLHAEGLIYRGERIVNWCPRCQTALSDLEVVHQDLDGSLWHIRYPLKGGGEAVVATTRPETMLGDTAVAVHPDDERYRGLVGKTAILPLLDREIPVIADAYVDREFGTGTLKITPGHDQNDFEVGVRHNLEVINIFNPDATINDHGGPYAGLDRYKARDRVVSDLEAKGLLVKVEPRRSPIAHCQRCSTRLEPLVSLQWWMRMKELAAPAIRAVELGETRPDDPDAVRLIPDNAPAVFYEWMRNIRDWCISRQLWWGHRIPAWYCRSCGKTIVAKSAPAKCDCGGEVDQDPDTLDTWFSSALWPFSTLGWPDDGEMKRLGFDCFYPTDVLVTASDIIFLWVARMMMAGFKFTGKRPFHTVVFNSLVTDPEGKKMSKTKGNVVDPLDLFNQYGTDAVRFTLTSQETLRQSFRMSPEKVEHGRNFMNKIWNAGRFALGELEGYAPSPEPPANRSMADRWILSRTDEVVEQATKALDRYSFSEYALLLEGFFWHEFCDTYLELAKPALKDPARRAAAQWTLATVLDRVLKLMHPVVPYITEEIWQRLPKPGSAGKLLMLEPWPKPSAGRDEAGRSMAVTLEVVSAIRTLRHETGIEAGETVTVAARAEATADPAALAESLKLGYVETLCKAKLAVLPAGDAPPSPHVTIHIPGYSLFLALPKPADPAAEKARLEKELVAIQGLLEKRRATLANADFLAKAPRPLVEESRKAVADFEARLARHAERLAQL
jgi:valyl-tRNA synthetase